MLDLEALTEHARYSDVLQKINVDLGGKEILDLKYDRDYSGFVDISVLLDDGRVWSYYYSYGSCGGCDEWEGDGHSNLAIKMIMMKESTYFDNIVQYNEWRKSCPAR